MGGGAISGAPLRLASVAADCVATSGSSAGCFGGWGLFSREE